MYASLCTRFAFLLFITIIFVGCSGSTGGPITPSDVPEELAIPEKEADSNRMLWGIWELRFDPVGMSVSAKPLRTALPHFDITDHILPPACDDCFSIGVNGFDTVTRILDADVTLRNPLAISGRDVRGILFTNQYGYLVTNANGWTELWDIPNGEDINPFRTFAKGETNRVFAGGTEHTENYLIYIPQPPNYWAIQFAVDASYPANCKEPYEISDLYGSDIMYDYQGCEAAYMLDLYDWQDDIDSVRINAVEITSDESTSFTYVSGNVWTVELANLESAPAGDYRCLVTSTSANSTIPLYQYVNLTIEGTPAPVVTSIDPDFGPAGDLLTGVEITGENFYGPTAQVRLMMDGEPDIVSGDVDVISLTSISCEFDFPLDAAQGLYDVEVVNVAGAPGIGEDLFEVESPMPDNPIDVTPPGLNFSPYDVAVSGNYAITASGANGLNVFNISDPLNPEWVHQVDNDDQAYRIAIQGNYAYVADLEGGLLIYDISSPESASLYHTISTIVASAVDVAGDYAYVLDRFDGLKIIDVSSPGAPTIEKTVDLTAEAEFGNVDYEDGYAYITTRDEGMKIVDVDPIASAYVVATVAADLNTYDVEVESGLAFVCCEYGKLLVYDVDPPESISLSQELDEIVAFGVEIAGDYAYVAAVGGGFNGLAIVDISNPADVFLTKEVETSPGHPAETAIFGDYVILMDQKIGLRIIDVNPVNSAVVVVEIDTPSGGQDVWVENGLAYYINECPGVVIAGVSSPPDTQYIKRFDDVETSGIFISDGLAYITNWDSGLYIYDIDPIESANLINSVELPQHPNNLVVENGYAYVAATWDGDFHIVDVDPPLSASLVKTVDVPLQCNYVDLFNGYAFVTGDEDGLYIIDIDPPSTASIISTIPITGASNGIEIEDGYAYIAAEDLQILDIDPVGSTSIVKTVLLPDNGKAIHLSQGYAYVTCGPAGLQIIDIDPIEDAYILTAVPVKHYAIGIDVVDNMAYIGDIESGLRIIQLW